MTADLDRTRPPPGWELARVGDSFWWLWNPYERRHWPVDGTMYSSAAAVIEAWWSWRDRRSTEALRRSEPRVWRQLEAFWNDRPQYTLRDDDKPGAGIVYWSAAMPGWVAFNGGTTDGTFKSALTIAEDVIGAVNADRSAITQVLSPEARASLEHGTADVKAGRVARE